MTDDTMLSDAIVFSRFAYIYLYRKMLNKLCFLGVLYEPSVCCGPLSAEYFAYLIKCTSTFDSSFTGDGDTVQNVGRSRKQQFAITQKLLLVSSKQNCVSDSVLLFLYIIGRFDSNFRCILKYFLFCNCVMSNLSWSNIYSID